MWWLIGYTTCSLTLVLINLITLPQYQNPDGVLEILFASLFEAAVLVGGAWCFSWMPRQINRFLDYVASTIELAIRRGGDNCAMWIVKQIERFLDYIDPPSKPEITEDDSRVIYAPAPNANERQYVRTNTPPFASQHLGGYTWDKWDTLIPGAKIILNDPVFDGKEIKVTFRFIDPQGLPSSTFRVTQILHMGLNEFYPPGPGISLIPPNPMQTGTWTLEIFLGKSRWNSVPIIIQDEIADTIARMVVANNDLEMSEEAIAEASKFTNQFSADDLLNQ